MLNPHIKREHFSSALLRTLMRQVLYSMNNDHHKSSLKHNGKEYIKLKLLIVVAQRISRGWSNKV